MNFLAIIIIIVSLLSVFVFVAVKNLDESQVIRTNLNTTIQLKNSTETLLKEVDHSLAQLGLNSSVVNFADNYNFDTYEDISNVMTSIGAVTSSNPYILTCYVYYFNDEKVVDGITYELMNIKDEGNKELIHNVYNLYKSAKSPKEISIYNIKIKNNSTLVFVKAIPTTTLTSKALIIAVVDPRYFKDIFNSIKLNSGSGLYIIDKNGEVISQQNNNMPESKDKTDQIQLKTIPSKSSGSSIDNKNGNLITYVYSDSLNWRYIYLVPLNEAFKSMHYITEYMILIWLLFLILGITIAYILAKRLYRPINKITSLINKDSFNNPSKSKDDIVYIEENLSELISQNRSFGDIINKSMPILKQSFLNRIISSEVILDENVWENFKYYKINIQPESFYAVLIIEIDQPGILLQSYSEKQINMFDIYQNSLIYDFFVSKNVGIETLRLNTNRLVAFLSYSSASKDMIDQDLCEDTEIIHKQISTNLKFTITIGMSSVVDNIKNMSVLFNEAKIALEYKAVIGNNRIVRFTEVPVIATTNYGVSYIREKEICNYLKHGEKIKCCEAIDDYFNYIKNYCINYHDLQYIYANFLHSTIECSISMAIDINKIISDDNLYKQLILIETIQEAELWFINLYNEIFSYIDNIKNNKVKEIVVKIKEYIDSNYMSPDLSLDLIADKVGFSVSYLTKLFSDNEGLAIKEYITAERIKKASELLQSSKVKIKDIALQVGYSNERSFMIIFKKYSGETPREYRDKRIKYHEKSLDNEPKNNKGL
jgi:two-component system response regulator YesN